MISNFFHQAQRGRRVCVASELELMEIFPGEKITPPPRKRFLPVPLLVYLVTMESHTKINYIERKKRAKSILTEALA